MRWEPIDSLPAEDVDNRNVEILRVKEAPIGEPEVSSH